MSIDNEIIENYFECDYKSHLKLNGILGEKCNLEIFQCSEAKRSKIRYFTDRLKIALPQEYNEYSLQEIIKQGENYIFNVDVIFENLKLRCDCLKKVSSKSRLEDFYYIPVLIVPTEHIAKKTKVLIAGIANALSLLQTKSIPFAEVVYGQRFKLAKIKTESYLKEFYKVLGLLKESNKFQFHLNPHCAICEFSKVCRKKAIEEDHLSLLKGITRERVKELNNKGIFSIYQLSYTFRPKRKLGKATHKKRKRSIELQALAIRERKIFIYDSPPLLPQARVEMFLDIEGLPEDNFYYLIGLTVKAENEIKHHHFWADTRTEQLDIVQQFLATVLSYDDFVIYHYGSYELTFLKKMKEQLSLANKDHIQKVLSCCYNILSDLYTHIYFPTYSNGLKEIGNFIGFNWSSVNANGIESMFWRKKWETLKQNSIKEELIAYNKEDCCVLVNLKEIISTIIEKNSSSVHDLKVNYVKDLQKEQKTTFIVNESFFPEIKFINECSYFDYQRDKVYTKAKESKKKSKGENVKKNKYFYNLRPNKIVDIKRQTCEQCKSELVYAAKNLSRKIVDLKFSPNGIKVLITQYNSNEYACITCKHRFMPHEYPTLRLKLGHNLIAWAIFQHIVNKQSFNVIENNFKELFHLSISNTTFFACKDYFIRYYEPTYHELLSCIIKSDVLYVDETPFSMQFEKGYVWVFTNGSEVVSIYKPNREAGFLKEMLKDFKGVLVTDFYKAYDSLNCRQQKCLIHLIRDFNSDLIKNPFNEEFKAIAKDFTILLQKIVLVINRFGLKHYHLKKYQKEVSHFFKNTLTRTYQTEIAQQYQNRLRRNQYTLFEFLNHDNVAWNNSNAEHAIKILALHANKNINAFRKTRIDDYLKIMSIYQTCVYKNISFLKFLLSRKIVLNDFKK